MVTGLTDRWWKVLLLLAKTLERHTGPVEFCSLRPGKTPEVKVNEVLSQSGDASAAVVFLDSEPDVSWDAFLLFRITHLIDVAQIQGEDTATEVANLLTTYLPYCFLPVYARRWNRAVAVSHFAQSLDGRIATDSGDSRWIGHEDNRTHAHRMRALCRGILIGSKTLKRDKPALTVRRVEGPHPRPIVLGSSVGDGKDLIRSWGSSVLTFASKDGAISPLRILKSLYEKGISSVYIEGGSATTSRFLEEDAVDIVQVHISPMILGSGIPSFSLTPIHTVGEARRFRAARFMPVGDGIMFVGVPESPGR
ncbi:MAG: RibD family protein [Fidelibacterota bacterium]